MLTYEITDRDHCRRLESFLRNLLPAAPAAYPRKLIRSGGVKLNGSLAAPDTLLALHDMVTVKESAALTALLTGTSPTLDILYEDDHIAVVNKPAGLPMHRTAELESDLVAQGMDFMARRTTACKLYPVNRLDRGTSGTVILAKSSSSAGMFGRQVKETGLDKLYLALVAGTVDDSGVISAALDDKESETRYSVLAQGSDCSLLAVTPISGRMHQIRRHLEMIGHPVMGDKRYGHWEMPELPGFALHSFRTVLAMPDDRRLTVCAPLPGELLTVCELHGIPRLALLQALAEFVSLMELESLQLAPATPVKV
jgi:RluA family pseudouridine synthase